MRFVFLISVQNLNNIRWAKDIVNSRYTNETTCHPQKWIKERKEKTNKQLEDVRIYCQKDSPKCEL